MSEKVIQFNSILFHIVPNHSKLPQGACVRFQNFFYGNMKRVVLPSFPKTYRMLSANVPLIVR